MSAKRIRQVAEAIKEHLALMLVRGQISDPRVKRVTIQLVKVTPDLQIARVYFSVFGSLENNEKALVTAGLKSASGFMRKSLGEALGMRYTPNLEFFYDETMERAARIEEIFAQINCQE